MTSRTIKDADDWGRWLIHIADMPFPFSISATKKPKRTEAQNALIHVWFGVIALHVGDTPADDIKAACNLKYGRPLLVRDDPKWAEMWHKCFAGFSHEAKLDAIGAFDIPFTRRMNVKQLCEYMDQMQRDAAKRGIILEDKEGLGK